MRRHVGNATVVILVSIASATVQTWSPQGHRLVALATSRGDRWRDCVVDRIRYNQERLADATLDRADRAIALKFLVHLIGAALMGIGGVTALGCNDIPVSAFGSPTCAYDDGTTYPCNLHGV